MYEWSNQILRMKKHHQQLLPPHCDVVQTHALARGVPAVDNLHAAKALSMRHQRVEYQQPGL
jgi:hypothetical protein